MKKIKPLSPLIKRDYSSSSSSSDISDDDDDLMAIDTVQENEANYNDLYDLLYKNNYSFGNIDSNGNTKPLYFPHCQAIHLFY